LLFQKRHPLKDTNPTKFDITSAGHLLAGESIADGIREPQEELGIDVTMEQLIPLGVIRYVQQAGSIIDREICHVHLSFFDQPLASYRPQLDEVSGLVQIRLEEALALFRGQAVEVKASGVEWQEESGRSEAVQYKLRLDDFVPHGSYYVTMLEQIRQLAKERE
jgi:isopentenyldiphosphate isomerase